MDRTLERTLRSIQRVCAAGLDSLALRRELAQRMTGAVAFDAYAFSTCDPDTGLMAHTLAEGVPPGLGRDYLERVYPHETATISIDASRRASAVFSMLDMSPEARDAYLGHGITSQIHMALSVDHQLWATWCLMRGDRSPRHNAQSLAFLQRAAPCIARGLKAAACVDEAHGAAASADASSTSPGVIVLDSRNRPVLRTPLAARWLLDLADAGLGMPDDVPLCVLGIAMRVRRNDARRDGRGSVPQDTLLRLRGASGQWYALRGSLAEPDDSGSAAVVIVVRPAVRREIAPILTSLYALSERERQVVTAVARGESTKGIAASLGVSPHTVNEHLERACRKIGVRGRKALVAKLFVDGYAPTLMAPSPRALADRFSAATDRQAIS